MKKKSVLSICLITLLLFAGTHVWATGDNPDLLIAKGKEFSQKGDFEHAALNWENALNLLDPKTDTAKYLDTTLLLGNAFQSLGYHRKAVSALSKALPIIEKSDDHSTNAAFLNTLSDLYFSLGYITELTTYLPKAMEEAVLAEDKRIQANVLINLGNVLSAEKDYQRALAIYGQSLELAEQLEHDPGLKAKVSMNIARAEYLDKHYDGIETALNYALVQIENLPDSHDKAKYLISMALLIQEIAQDPDIRDQDTKDEHSIQITGCIYDLFDGAGKLAEKLDDPRLISYACGYLGQLYEAEARYTEAMKLTRRAVFFAQMKDSPQILYLWQWQLGRLFKAKGDKENAVRAFRNSISTLNPIRQELFIGYRSREDFFNKNVKPVYLGLAELLLKQAETIQDKKLREKKLLQARDTMELLKTAELEDFFKDECMIDGQETRLEYAPPRTAVLYPIPLPDSLALLLILPDSIEQINVPVGSKHLRKTIAKYREGLQTRLNRLFLYESQQIYDWTIRPAESKLAAHKVDTLLVAPDGALRLIPFSTLHDGTHFLIEKYAIGTIPAIRLTDMNPVVKENSNILLSGLSEGVQEFSPLPSVHAELRDIKEIMGGSILIQNKDYTIDNLVSEFKSKEYSFVHIATHGVFGGTPEESFLLTYDNRLDMNHLEKIIGLGRFRKQKVELLTLSACQTALGNERAAMGLAGAAVKAGVKSVIATLWFVDDEATSLAIREFYRQLKKPGISKVKAMQNVQKKLISQKRYWHPLYWGPFLVIGNFK